MWLYDGYTWGHALYLVGLEGMKALAPFLAAGLAAWIAYGLSSHSRTMRG